MIIDVVAAGPQGPIGPQGPAGPAGPPSAFTPTVVSTAQILTATAVDKHFLVTTGSTNIAITLPAANLVSGRAIQISKVDSGIGRVEVNGTLAHLFSLNDLVTVQSIGTGWIVTDVRIAPIGQTFSSSGTYVVPPLARNVKVQLVGGGGGGSSGRQSGDEVGGGGGAGGPYMEATFAAARLGIGNSISVVIGAGGAGGTTVNTPQGQSGADGSPTTFGPYLKVYGAIGATFDSGGFNTYSLLSSGFGGNGGSDPYDDSGNYSGQSAEEGGTGPNLVAGGGGGGGGFSTSQSVSTSSGGSGGDSNIVWNSTLAGGAGGTSSSRNGANGASATAPFALDTFRAGAGGGGGGVSVGSNGGNGGNGGWPGGGGGGGGAAASPQTAGTGGNGGDGAAYVLTYFG